jgi:hypothetical protein
MIDGAGLVDVFPHLLAMAIMTSIFLAVGAISFRWD